MRRSESARLKQENDALLGVIYRVENMLRNAYHTTFAENGRFNFIPLSNTAFVGSLKLALVQFPKVNPKDIKFLDCGSGPGVKVALARYVFELDAEGYEINPKYLAGALGLVLKQDILECTNYDQYDIIYYYCPFSDEDKQRKFERLVENTAKIGAVLICHNKRDYEISRDLRFKKVTVEWPVWQKVSN